VKTGCNLAESSREEYSFIKGCISNEDDEENVKASVTYESHSFIHSFIHSSIALQHFVRPLPFFQFRKILYTNGRTPWPEDQPVARPLRNHGSTGIQTHDSSVWEGEGSS
jgi:hypothetical protein